MQRYRRRRVWKLALGVALLATSALAAPEQVKCGPAQHGCGPAVAIGAGANGLAPSWVPSMLAVYMLDEATGTRVNAQGTASRNLAMTGAVGSDTVNKMQGVAAAVLTDNTTKLAATDPAFSNLVSPLSMGCWARPAATQTSYIFQKPVVSGGFVIDQETAAYKFYIQVPTNYAAVAASMAVANTYAHVVGTYAHPTVTIYVNGVSKGTNAAGAPLPTSTSPLQISGVTNPYAGQVDECFIVNMALAATSVCRICSCGVDGTLCTCNGPAFTSTGRNASACGSCALPANCSAATPS